MRTVEEISADVHTVAGSGDTALLLHLASEAEALPHASGQCVMHIARGIAASQTSDLPAALREYQAALALSESTPQTVRTASILNNMGSVTREMGDVEASISYCSRALALAQEAGNEAFMALAMGNLGVAMAVLGEYAQAHEYMARALALEESIGNTASIAATLCNMGIVAYNVGDYAGSVELAQRALDIHEAQSNTRGMATVLGNIGNSYVAMQDIPLALAYFHRALPLHEQLENRASVARVNGNIGVALRNVGDQEGAIRHLEISSALSEEIGNMHSFAFSTCTLADAYTSCGRTADARAALARVADICAADRQVHPHYLGVQARIHATEGDLDGAATLYQRALDGADTIGSKLMQAELHKELRDLARTRGDLEGYVRHNEAFMQLTEDLRGQEANRRLAMVEAQKRIDEERREKERHRILLHSTLPPSIADRVMRGETVNDAIDHAAVMFMDMVGFTTMASTMPADEVVALLSEIFTLCDAVMAEHDVMKIKTIGDSYMAAAFGDDAVVRSARAALAMTTLLPARFPDLRFRIGLHCGPVTAGVIGTERLQYDVWGDTVNVASRMESSGEAGRVHVSRAVADALRDQEHNTESRIEERGEVEIKGKGSMVTYWVAKS